VKRTISVLLVDDHALVRDTLTQWLNSAPDISVAGAAATADQAVSIALRLRPDVVVMDIDMPGLVAFDAAKTILASLPETRVLFLSAFSNDRYIEQALAAGAAGFVTKGQPAESVARAIQRVASGDLHFSPDIQARIVIDPDGPRLAATAHTRASTLTDRELEVLHYLASGMSKKEMARAMHVSVGTVNNHAANIMRKLDIHDRVELARFAIREGLAEP
jgi:DNA-binding NarL/FixJ family response regulator